MDQAISNDIELNFSALAQLTAKILQAKGCIQAKVVSSFLEIDQDIYKLFALASLNIFPPDFKVNFS